MTPSPSPRAPYPLLALFIVLATAIAGLAYRYHLTEKEAIQHEVDKQLLSIAEMKINHITAWRAVKVGEARIILNSRFTLEAVQRVVAGRSNAADRTAVSNWVDALCRELHYAGVTLTDSVGNTVITRGRQFGEPSHIHELALRVAALDDVTLTDFHQEGPRPAHLGLNVPLRVEPGAPAFGAMLIGLDPDDYLFPLLRSWPVATSSAESALVRRDGGDVVFLSPLRYHKSSVNLRIPLSQRETAAVRAALGEEGVLEAKDYRGVPIFAAAQPVPGTTWLLLTKIDAEEVLAPLRWRSGLMGAFAISLICFAAIGVFVLWRRNELQSYRQRYQSELERRQAAERYEAERSSMNEELRRAIEALQVSESHSRAAFEQVAVGMNRVSLEGRFLAVNQRYCEITGYKQEELLRLGYADVTHPDDREADNDHVRRILAGEQTTQTWGKRYIRKDGALIRVAVTASLLRSASGEPVNILAVVEDVTASARAKEELRQSEERFRQVVEEAPEGILVVVGPEIRYVNPAAVALFGAPSAASLIGSALLDRAHPDDRASVAERNAIVVDGRRHAPANEHLYLRVDGEPIPVQVSASPITYDGRPAGLVFFRDMTAHKRAEEERNRLEQRLHQAQKMESVGRLAGGVAHDFNNHLTVINGYCDMLLDALGTDDPLREELSEIRAAGDRAAALTQQLLAFSRKQIIEPKPLVINDVIDEYCRLVRRLIGDDIEVVAELDPALGPVMADRGQMHQILMNLAVNARDAMPGGGKIIVATANADIDAPDSFSGQEVKSGPYVVLTLSDTGAGMSQEVLEKIFEPFFTTKPLGVGTGLGLSTVYGIVEQSGGFIRVSSQPDNGTTFRIYLPRIEQVPETSGPRVSTPQRQSGSETVLVVEDQAEVRRLAMGILKKSGYRLIEAANGPDALSMAEAFPERIDLLVTDVIMPGMTGRELASRLQAIRPKMKVLYTSGYTADVIGREGVLDSGVAYLPKPFAPADLAAKVRLVLSNGKGRRRILVIDDDAAVRTFLAEMLGQAGYDVVTAPEGRAGMRVVDDGAVDLVITDLVMPEREGLETVRLLRQRYPALSIIAISGAFGGEFLKAAGLLGAQATFLKPVQSETLLQTVQQLIG